MKRQSVRGYWLTLTEIDWHWRTSKTIFIENFKNCYHQSMQYWQQFNKYLMDHCDSYILRQKNICLNLITILIVNSKSEILNSASVTVNPSLFRMSIYHNVILQTIPLLPLFLSYRVVIIFHCHSCTQIYEWWNIWLFIY